ncbi:MAG: excisionase family DNA-binding protein [Deltaproteobacteria bacterium]|nr:excisionase family DNA-binding protein [Deltaproteobacteria bacterium]
MPKTRVPPDAPAPTARPPRLLHAGEVARLAGLHKTTVLQAVRRGEIRASRTVGRSVRIALPDATAFLQSRGIALAEASAPDGASHRGGPHRRPRGAPSLRRASPRPLASRASPGPLRRPHHARAPSPVGHRGRPRPPRPQPPRDPPLAPRPPGAGPRSAPCAVAGRGAAHRRAGARSRGRAEGLGGLPVAQRPRCHRVNSSPPAGADRQQGSSSPPGGLRCAMLPRPVTFWGSRALLT